MELMTICERSSRETPKVCRAILQNHRVLEIEMGDWVYVLVGLFIVLVLDGGTGILIVPGFIFLIGYVLWGLVRAFQAKQMSGTYTIEIPSAGGDPGYIVRAAYKQGVDPKDCSVEFLEIRADNGQLYATPDDTPHCLRIERAVGEFFNRRRRELKLPNTY